MKSIQFVATELGNTSENFSEELIPFENGVKIFLEQGVFSLPEPESE